MRSARSTISTTSGTSSPSSITPEDRIPSCALAHKLAGLDLAHAQVALNLTEGVSPVTTPIVTLSHTTTLPTDPARITFRVLDPPLPGNG